MMYCLRKYEKMRQQFDAKDVPEQWYTMMMMSKMITLFKWDRLPRGLPQREIEYALQFSPQAMCGIVERRTARTPHNCDFIATDGSLANDIDAYGYGKTLSYAVVDQSGECDIDGECAIGFNNMARVPSYVLVRKYADILEEIDRSIKILVIRTRATKVFSASTDNGKAQIERLYDTVKKGDYFAFFDENTLKDHFLDSEPTITAIDIADGYTADDINSLLIARKEIFSQFCYEIGIPITTPPKKAQVNEDELIGYADYSAISIEDMLNARKEFADEINRVFGLSITVDYCNTIKKIMERRDNNGKTDNDGRIVGQDRPQNDPSA